jgi:hypothetical protein
MVSLIAKIVLRVDIVSKKKLAVYAILNVTIQLVFSNALNAQNAQNALNALNALNAMNVLTVMK